MSFDLNCIVVGMPQEDVERVAMATGAVMQTSLNDLSENVLGTCERFEERQIGSERYNHFLVCALQNIIASPCVWSVFGLCCALDCLMLIDRDARARQ